LVGSRVSVGSVGGRPPVARCKAAVHACATFSRGDLAADDARTPCPPRSARRPASFFRFLFETVGGSKTLIFSSLWTSDRALLRWRSAERCGLLLCRHYQEVLPAEGVGWTKGPKIPIEQMFSDYVHTRGMSNWKFWIVSLMPVTSFIVPFHRLCSSSVHPVRAPGF